MFPKNFATGNVQSAILETVVTLKVQSKVEHLTRIAYQLDFLIQNQEAKNNGIKDLISQQIAHYIHQPFSDQVNRVAIDFDISLGLCFFLVLLWRPHTIHLWRRLIQILPVTRAPHTYILPII